MRPVSEWDEEYVLGLTVGEFDWLEVKGRMALDLTIARVNERDVLRNLSKAVSAFANGGGGILVYGLQNPSPNDSKWIVDDGGVATTIKGNTREWLETIVPHLVEFPLTAFNVYSIVRMGTSSQIAEGRALFLVEIPDSLLAPHQASDNNYYIRVAGRSRPAGHRLVLDIIGRRQHPKLELEFAIELTSERRGDILGEAHTRTRYGLEITAQNTGNVLAQYVNCFIRLPVDIVPKDKLKYRKIFSEGGTNFCEFYQDNTVRDVTGVTGGMAPQYGPSRYDPILPRLTYHWSLELVEEALRQEFAEYVIKWSCYADNSPPAEGEIPLKDIPKADRRHPGLRSP